MILHTVYPLEEVLRGWDTFEPDYMEMNWNGLSMQVERISPQHAKIIRIYSGNAADYLNADYAPGTIVEFTPVVRR